MNILVSLCEVLVYSNQRNEYMIRAFRYSPDEQSLSSAPSDSGCGFARHPKRNL